jgi:plasmid stability protein
MQNAQIHEPEVREILMLAVKTVERRRISDAFTVARRQFGAPASGIGFNQHLPR